MTVVKKKESISKFCRAQIRTINGKKARIEKIVDEYFLGFAIRKKRDDPNYFDRKKDSHPKLFKVKERLSNDICYYLLGREEKIRFDDNPRNWLEDIWAIYASCRQKEYENSLFKKGWDLEDAAAEAKSAFKINTEISDLIGTSLERKIPDSLLLNKITDPDLKKFVQNHINEARSEILKRDGAGEINEDRIFHHNFIFKHGIYDTPQALVERTILLRALLILNGINPYGRRDSEDDQERYAFKNPIKASIFGLNILASRLRKTLFTAGEGATSAQNYWGTNSYEFKFYEDCVLGGVNELINKLENFTRLKSYSPNTENEFKEPISLKVLASLRDITPIRMRLELGENANSRKILHGPDGEKKEPKLKEGIKEGKAKYKKHIKHFKFSDVREYLYDHPKTQKVFFPLEIDLLSKENRDLTITDIFN
tara:strand:- start:582 stop:1859 length:1278 start_codon:yes stop_codon:yes gene_type:complete